MPSGAKKRKAAKKKKEKGASTTTNNPSSSSTSTSTSTTTADSHGDEDLKHHESDGGEVSDHHNSEHHLTEGEEEEIEKKREENSHVEGNKSVDDVKNEGNVEKRAPEDEGVVQIERESKQDDEFDKKGGSSKSSSSSSSSDDESHAVEKDIPVIDNAPVVDSFSEGQSLVTDHTSVSKFESCAEKGSVFEEKVLEDSGSSAVNSLSADVGGQKENGERKLSSLEESGRLYEDVKDLTPGNKKEEASNAAATSDAKESGTDETEEKLTLSYNASRDDAIKHAEHAKDSEVLGSSERQPLAASAVQPVQRTSWKGCCGLFELFAGSNA